MDISTLKQKLGEMISEIELSKEEEERLDKDIADYKKCAEDCKKKLKEIEEYTDYLKERFEYFDKLASTEKKELLFRFSASYKSIMDLSQFIEMKKERRRHPRRKGSLREYIEEYKKI